MEQVQKSWDVILREDIEARLSSAGHPTSVAVHNMPDYAGFEVRCSARALGLPVRVLTARIVVPYDMMRPLVRTTTAANVAAEIVDMLRGKGALESGDTPLMGGKP